MLGYPGATSAPVEAHHGEGLGQIWLRSVACSGGEQRLEDCNHGSWGSHYCTHAEDASVHCLHTVRLVNSGVAHKGRVEIFHDGLWGTICGYYYWGINNAKVVCKMLGFPDVLSAPTSSFYGPGTGKIWLYAVQCTGYEATLEDCYNNGWGDVSSCNHGYDASVECISTVRIVSGNGINEGSVEIYHGGIWGTICDDGWDIKDAEVVCRMMGFPEAKSAPVRAYYGKGIGQIWLSSVSCSGDEQRLENCNHGSWGSHHCSHDEDASVHCLPTVRLADGQLNKGRVEIFHAGAWGTICDFSWDIEDARVVCRTLKFPGVISALKNAYYGEGTGQIWLNNVNCDGNEDSLDQCLHNSWGSHSCSHGDDAAVECLSTVRIVDGNVINEGRVEIYHEGIWGTICDDSWGINDAKVVCIMLGFPGATSAPVEAHHGIGLGQVWLSSVSCSGGEKRLEDCNHGSWGSHHCTHAKDASVHCLPTVRLVNSGVAHKGRVEIFHDGLWGTICGYYYWDINNAKVVCKMLGFPDVLSAPTSSFYGPGTGKIWLYAVQCTGYEATLEDCYNNGWGDVSSCNHGYDASVECISTVRIVSGNGINEGRVEIYHEKVWGTICDDSWDIKDAEVVCRMMGFPEAKSAPVRAYYGKGVGQIWLSSVSCTGDEQRLEDCNHGSWGSHHCSHEEDASVHCLLTDIKPGNFWILGIELGIMLILLLIPMCMYRGSLQKLLKDIVETTRDGLIFLPMLPYRTYKACCKKDDNRVTSIPAQPRQLTRASTASEINIDHVYYIQPSREPVASSAPPVTNNTQEISEDRLCVICLSEEKNVFFGPCGHVCCCNDCGMRSDVTDCPVCRNRIEQRQRTFL
uniref:deleted in malignant brain tumors 1 protein-like n=1 Tax=Styela clava TaxID=7725 RepID=UPI00193A0EE0|nr:deleted in malignant brain tumors 1 protein-like [Styela clava]